MDTVCILIAKDHLSASSAKALLETNNIFSMFPNEHLTGVMPHYGMTTGGFKLFVSSHDEDRTNEVLKDHRSDLEYSCKSKKELKTEHCPKCGSSEIEIDMSYKLWIGLFGALFSIPFPAKKCINHCKKCEHKWK